MSVPSCFFIDTSCISEKTCSCADLCGAQNIRSGFWLLFVPHLAAWTYSPGLIPFCTILTQICRFLIDTGNKIWDCSRSRAITARIAHCHAIGNQLVCPKHSQWIYSQLQAQGDSGFLSGASDARNNQSRPWGRGNLFCFSPQNDTYLFTTSSKLHLPSGVWAKRGRVRIPQTFWSLVANTTKVLPKRPRCLAYGWDGRGSFTTTNDNNDESMATQIGGSAFSRNAWNQHHSVVSAWTCFSLILAN